MSARYTIDEALEAVAFGRFQWILLLLSGIGFCATTVELISVSLLKGSLMQQWPLANTNFALIMSATFAGELIGGLAWGFLSDKLGRRATFVGTALMAAIAGMSGAFAPGFYSFVASRFFLGMAIGRGIPVDSFIYNLGGCLSIDFVYFIEFVPATARGFRTTFIILLGIMACLDSIT